MIELLEYVFNYMICMIDLTLLDLNLLFFGCTCQWKNEHVLLVGMVLLKVHKGFSMKSTFFMMSLFFNMISYMCAYGLILGKSGVLTPFLPFPHYFRFRSLKGFLRWHWRRHGYLDHPRRVGPQFPRAMPLSSLWGFFS